MPEQALRVYLNRLENGSGQGDAVLGLNGGEESTEDNRSESGATTDEVGRHGAAYADTSTDEILDEYNQFATSVLDRSENTVQVDTRYIGRYSNTPPHRRHR